MNRIKVLWVDAETMWTWETTLSILEKKYGFQITRLESARTADVIQHLPNQDAVAIHSGTFLTIHNLRELLKEIRARYPQVAIGLLTNTTHPTVESLADFCIPRPVHTKVIARTIRDRLAHVRANRRS